MSIIEDIKGDEPELADKLEENKANWLRNFKLMNLYNLTGLEIKKVVKHG